MGDISTHAGIFEESANLLKRTPDDDAVGFVELGNWLADTSQFRDPPAFSAVKTMVWKELVAKGLSPGALRFGDIDHYLDELWGTPDQRGGRFAKWASGFVLASAIESFGLKPDKDAQRCASTMADKAAERWKGMTQKQRSTIAKNATHGKRDADRKVPRLDPEEIYRAVRAQWTQYYPHEHLDLPPVVPGGRRPRLEPSTELVQRVRDSAVPTKWETRRVARYLESHIDAIAQQLREVQALRDPGRIGKLPLHLQHEAGSADSLRGVYQQALLHLGRARHAVEDYFFHSNYAEIATVSALAEGYAPGDRWDETFELEGFWDYVGVAQGWDVGAKRSVFRRLLDYPGEGMAPTKAPLTGPTSVVYTGGFGATDVFHTLYGALEGFEDRYTTVLRPLLVSEDTLEPLDYVFIEARRRELSEAKVRNEVLTVYWARIDSRYYEARLTNLAQGGCIHYLTQVALAESFKHDRELRDAYSFAEETSSSKFLRFMGWDEDEPLGVTGFVFQLLDRVQSEHDTAARAAKASREVMDTRRDGGPTNEAAASHSLLSKDSPETTLGSKPLRTEAVDLATYVSRAVTQWMVPYLHGRVAGTPDWNRRLRLYLGHPEQALMVTRGGVQIPWHQDALKGGKPMESDIPTPTRTPSASPRVRKALEREYNAIGEANEKVWKSTSS